MSKKGIFLRGINTPGQETFQIDREGFVIGKGTEGTDGVVSGVCTVSRQHLQADCKEGRVWITDLSSTNGTFINGIQIPPMTPREIFAGDEIALADYIFLAEPVEKERLLIVEEPGNDWSTLEQAVYENLSCRYEIQVIRDYFALEEYFRQERKLDVMLVEESLYGKYLERHQIGWLILLKPEMKEDSRELIENLR